MEEVRRRKPTAVSSGCSVSTWEKSQESTCSETPDLDRSYFPKLEYLLLPGFTAIISILLDHTASGHPSMSFLLYCTVQAQNCSVFPFLSSALGTNTQSRTGDGHSPVSDCLKSLKKPAFPHIPNTISIT